MNTEILYGMKAITDHFKTRRVNIKRWKAAGAPIVVTNMGNGSRYMVRVSQLWRWLEENGALPKTRQEV